MENISRIKEKCVGCKSCEQSCPKHCISMVENKEGFWYPSVDEKSCIECKVCLKKCPVENTEFHRNEPHKVWAWRNKNDVDIMRSASGGAADSAAKTVLQMGGAVYGAAYDEQLVVSHIEVTDEAEREKIQSSKYVQSDPKDSYAKVKQRLSEGKTVLFTGTPCQIAGLYAFLGGNPENLYTVDLICHGVPSPKFFRKSLPVPTGMMPMRTPDPAMPAATARTGMTGGITALFRRGGRAARRVRARRGDPLPLPFGILRGRRRAARGTALHRLFAIDISVFLRHGGSPPFGRYSKL